MNGTIIPQASLFLGIIPALILLYISLKGYDGQYKEKNIFLSFIAGIIAGVIAASIEILTAAIGIFFIILFPLLEQLLKTMILNIRRLQERGETVIYGLCLGLAFGSVFTPVSLQFLNYGNSDFLSISLILIGAFGITLFHGATGVLLGFGIYKDKLMKYFIIVLLLHLPLTLVSLITAAFNIEFIQISLVFYGILLYWYATKKIMPQILEIIKRRKRKKKIE